MAPKANFVRFASPNERRTISREVLGFYHAVIIGAIYEVPEGISSDSPSTFFSPVRKCIEEHPSLSIVVRDGETETPWLERVNSIDLQEHIFVARSQEPREDEMVSIEKLLEPTLDDPFPSGIPPWKVLILPLSLSRCFVGFAYSHTIGDGLSGVSFHHTFLDGCTSEMDATSSEPPVVRTPEKELSGPFDTPQRLPISWSYLIAPLIGHLLPGWLINMLGLFIEVESSNANTWTGASVPADVKESRSRMKLCEVEAPVLARALRESRRHDSKLTAMVHQLIVRALSKYISDPSVDNFTSQTPTNMRHSIGMPSNEMGNFVSGCYVRYPRAPLSPTISEEQWDQCRLATQKLASSAATLQDQPIGLLRYVSNIRKWTLEKLGQRRSCSFEVSNVGAFDRRQDGASSSFRLIKIIFAQPGHVVGQPLSFSFASVKGGSLTYTVTWQLGSLGVPVADEEKFVEEICRSIGHDFESL